ncbi:MAG: HAMP domain-containing histidine kinase [bacterium]|nr:HAMP domain-containing histidine kinase [bacterium]
MPLMPELVRMEKIANMGHIAGQIGHEISNILTILKGKVDLYYLKLDSDSENNNPDEVLDSVIKHIDRLKLYAKSLQVIDEQPNFSKDNIDIVATIQKTVSELDSIGLLKYYNFTEDYPDQPMTINGNECLLDILFKNLLINAHHSMDGYGTLKISMKNTDNGSLEITIADSGCGISPDIKDRIFEQYYSTKPDGKATGLGLCVSRQILEYHDGTINIDSEPEKGTTVIIRLPKVI